MIRIVALLTVFNRKQKTLACLRHLFAAHDAYNSTASNHNVSLTVFLTDDGCTDGTADAVRTAFADKDIHILQGTGSLFWAGGMRLAWQAAIDSGTRWDYYLLLNDDTFLYNNVFAELFEADDYCYHKTGRNGMASGITCQPGNKNEITYGGMNFVNKTKGRMELLAPTGEPQRIDLTHANILLVHHTVVDKIGIFHHAYQHSCADNDYSMTARRHGFSAYTTRYVCGECEHDHDTNKNEAEKLMTMTLAERKKYVNSPTHSDNDYLIFVRRNMPIRYPMSLFVRTIRLYCPSLYYRITNFRGVYRSSRTKILNDNN